MAKGQPLTDEQKAARAAEKNAKFKELAGKRLPKARAALKALAALANYSPTETQTKWLVEQLVTEVNMINAAFQGKGPSAPAVEVPD